MCEGGYSLLCIATFTTLVLPLAEADLFTEKGVLLYEQGEAQAVTGTWTVLMILTAPTRLQFKKWLRHLEWEINTMKHQKFALSTDTEQWLHLQQI